MQIEIDRLIAHPLNDYYFDELPPAEFADLKQSIEERGLLELERIYGIQNGGDRKSDGHNVQLKSQDDLAKELEISKRQMSRFKSLTDLIPELQDAVRTRTGKNLWCLSRK